MHGFVDNVKYSTTKANLQTIEHYLRTEFKINLQKHFAITSHCISNALNDPTQQKFQRQCPTNDHQFSCQKCDLLKTTLNQIEELANTRIVEAAESPASVILQLESDAVEVNWAVEDIFRLRRHIVRAVHSERERHQILELLKVNDNSERRSFVTIDFAQKLLARHFLETQKLYFGKRGYQYHISHALTFMGGQFVSHSFVHILEGLKQVFYIRFKN